jgi:hypothetical protein
LDCLFAHSIWIRRWVGYRIGAAIGVAAVVTWAIIIHAGILAGIIIVVVAGILPWVLTGITAIGRIWIAAGAGLGIIALWIWAVIGRLIRVRVWVGGSPIYCRDARYKQQSQR